MEDFTTTSDIARWSDECTTERTAEEALERRGLQQQRGTGAAQPIDTMRGRGRSRAAGELDKQR